MTRSRATQKRYLKDLKANKTDRCPFCDPEPESLIKAYKYFNVIKNKYAYSYWDCSKVVDHLLIVPKKHIDSIIHLDKNESEEYIMLEKKYSGEMYEIFHRPADSHMKTVVHFHTHGIKLGKRLSRFYFYFKKPYFVFGK